MEKSRIRANFLLIALSLIFQVSLSKISIINPQTLRDAVGDDDGYMEAGMANFGHIDYGVSIVSALFSRSVFVYSLTCIEINQ